MDEYDFYFIDDDNRNAVTTHDHRTGSSGTSRPVRLQTARPSRTVVLGPSSHSQPRVHAYPQTTAARVFGNLSTGQIVEMVAQAYAALQSLPTAPTATKDAATDIGNLIVYQNALATHAKRDEQVRTLGALVARLVA